jgi:hypothetical protein
VSRIVQEKFETRIEPNSNDDAQNGWVSDKSVRVKKGTPGREGRTGGDWDSKTMDNAVHYQSLPPGTDINDQEVADIRKERSITGGTDDVTDNPSGGDFRNGFVKLRLQPTDDIYSREHNDAFYDEATVDGVTGYVERNNYLDRL